MSMEFNFSRLILIRISIELQLLQVPPVIITDKDSDNGI